MDDDAQRFAIVIGQNLLMAIIPILTSIVGGIVAILFWSNAPRQALLTLIAMALIFAATMAGVLITGFQASARSGDEARRRVSTAQVLYQGVRVMNAAAVGLLLVAVFTNRRKDVLELDD